MKAGWGAPVVAAVAIVSMTVMGTALPAAAHQAVGPPGLTCDEASVELKDFPNSSTVTFHIKVNATESSKTTQFSGPSGTATVSISDLTTATGSLDIAAYASWTVDGGGKSETTKITKVCHEEPPPTTGTQPGVVEVGGIEAERGASAPAIPAAAIAIAANPKFTG
jgi:hypothetical protein